MPGSDAELEDPSLGSDSYDSDALFLTDSDEQSDDNFSELRNFFSQPVENGIPQMLPSQAPRGDFTYFHRVWYIDPLRNFALHSSRGLSRKRIEKFEHFTADESLVGEKCLICMSDLEIGMEMVRLDCHVDHIWCKVCVKKWFKDHKTCPTCRHAFK